MSAVPLSWLVGPVLVGSLILAGLGLWCFFDPPATLAMALEWRFGRALSNAEELPSGVIPAEVQNLIREVGERIRTDAVDSSTRAHLVRAFERGDSLKATWPWLLKAAGKPAPESGDKPVSELVPGPSPLGAQRHGFR